jgi:hypothetical protein
MHRFDSTFHLSKIYTSEGWRTLTIAPYADIHLELATRTEKITWDYKATGRNRAMNMARSAVCEGL